MYKMSSSFFRHTRFLMWLIPYLRQLSSGSSCQSGQKEQVKWKSTWTPVTKVRTDLRVLSVRPCKYNVFRITVLAREPKKILYWEMWVVLASWFLSWLGFLDHLACKNSKWVLKDGRIRNQQLNWSQTQQQLKVGYNAAFKCKMTCM